VRRLGRKTWRADVAGEPVASARLHPPTHLQRAQHDRGPRAAPKRILPGLNQGLQRRPARKRLERGVAAATAAVPLAGGEHVQHVKGVLSHLRGVCAARGIHHRMPLPARRPHKRAAAVDGTLPRSP
jgi:hypothetical protein